jgi:hypothetical protein
MPETTDNIRDDICTFMIISLSRVFLERKMFQAKVAEKIKNHILCSVIFFPENRAVYEIMWKNVVEADRPQMTIQYNKAHALCMLDN